MTKPANPRPRASIRLPGYDYSTPGHYFVTICAANRNTIFATPIKDQFQLTPIGVIADECWTAITEHFEGVELDAYVIMPDHVHGIVGILDTNQREATNSRPSLISIVGSYKSAVSRRIRQEIPGWQGDVWQRSYYDHIIRSERDLEEIREYIVCNPGKLAEKMGYY
jgi:REP element-mobilizing transposase RayT